MSTTNARKEIAARLKQARERAGYFSAKDFCEKNQLPSSYIALEKGEIAIKSSHVARYCKLLTISLHWLLLGEKSIKLPINS